MNDFVRPFPEWSDQYLALEAAASAAYNHFAYDDLGLARQATRLLFDRAVAEYAAPHGWLWLQDEVPAGMIACLSARDLKVARLKSALTLERSGLLAADADLRDRMQRAATVMLQPRPGDYYLSRIAVTPAARGTGVGDRLLVHLETEACAAAANRIVLEVAADNAPALRFYERHGFRRADTKAVTDPRSGRSLAYHHLARDLA
ncbi:GNAT family N-acetyltransferase [Sphingomonas humi]|uniref:N-acetyltransferase domain-containing protein n=1 Tax=Sphingomonas humi TaxID=335630 RepID=A0ABP7S9M8_9SPHN